MRISYTIVSPTNNFTCDNPDTAIAGLQTLRTYSQDAKIGACTVKNIATTEGPITLTGNVHCTEDFTASAGSTNIRTNTDGYDIKCRTLKLGTNTNANNYLNLEKGSSLIFHDDAAGGFVQADAANLNCKGSASTGFFNSFGNQVQPCVEVTEGIGRRWGFAGTDGKAFAVSCWIKRVVGANEGYIVSTVFQPFNIKWAGRVLSLHFDG